MAARLLLLRRLTLTLAAMLLLSSFLISLPPSRAQEPPPANLSYTIIGNGTAGGSSFFFVPKEITIATPEVMINVTFVNGDTVTGSVHDFTIDVEGVRYATPRILPGEVAYLEFYINVTGTIPYWCSVPGHRELGMEGAFIVGTTGGGPGFSLDIGLVQGIMIIALIGTGIFAVVYHLRVTRGMR